MTELGMSYADIKEDLKNQNSRKFNEYLKLIHPLYIMLDNVSNILFDRGTLSSRVQFR